MDLILHQCDDEDDEFDRVAEGNIEQGAPRVPHSVCYDFGRVTEQAGERHYGDGVQGEDDGRVEVEGLGDDARRDEDEQHIDPAVEEGILGMDDETSCAGLHPLSEGRFLSGHGIAILTF